jgi:septum formation protein
VTRLILASTSPHRRAQLTQLGLAFEVQAPVCDEAEMQARGLTPMELVRELARRKALSLAPRHPHAAILGADQVAVGPEGRVLGKPGTREAARAQLLELQGREHQLVTAVALWHAGQLREHCDLTRLWVLPLGEDQIARYVERDEPLDCAGSYRIEAAGIGLFERIQSEDHTAIRGLPMLAVCRMLRETGIEVP